MKRCNATGNSNGKCVPCPTPMEKRRRCMRDEHLLLSPMFVRAFSVQILRLKILLSVVLEFPSNCKLAHTIEEFIYLRLQCRLLSVLNFKYYYLPLESFTAKRLSPPINLNQIKKTHTKKELNKTNPVSIIIITIIIIQLLELWGIVKWKFPSEREKKITRYNSIRSK